MIDQAIMRTGIRYGVMCAIAGFVIVLVLYFAGINPYGHNNYFSLLFIPVFIFLGSSYFKKYNDQNIGFLKALRVALSITFFAALCSAMLLYVFSNFAGINSIQMHIAEMKAMLNQPETKAQTLKMVGKENFELTLKNLDHTTPYDLAATDFFQKAGIGFLVSLVAATFFRK